VLPGYISLKNVSNKKAIERKVEVIDPGPGRLEVTRVETTSPYMKAQIVSTVKGENGKTEIRLVVNPGIPLGELNEKLIIFTNDPKEPKIEIPIGGNVAGGLIPFPDRFFLGMIDKGRAVSRDITVSQVGETDLKVIKVESDSRFIELQTTKKENNQLIFILIFQIRINISNRWHLADENARKSRRIKFSVRTVAE
ncbi:MAG: hypothetical protein HYS08_01670, partial [Chlamydiae bacterium]|nr:hypothetical protein [Chlamydiota bacterium]